MALRSNVRGPQLQSPRARKPGRLGVHCATMSELRPAQRTIEAPQGKKTAVAEAHPFA
jgi:hypothetical protein